MNDGDGTDNSLNYYTTPEITAELKKLEVSIRPGTTVPSAAAKQIVAWAEKQVGKTNFYCSYQGKDLPAKNWCYAFAETAYHEAGFDIISGNPADMPLHSNIKFKADGTVDYSGIPVGAVLISNGTDSSIGHASIYIGNGYVIEAGGAKVQKTPIDQSYAGTNGNCAPYIGWGFPTPDPQDTYKKLVVTIGGYQNGITPGANFSGAWNPAGDGIQMVYTTYGKSYKVYCQTSGDYSTASYWNGTIGRCGCGITSTSIILTGYGHDVTPLTIRDNGRIPDGNNMARYITEFEHYGIKSHFSTGNFKQEAIENLKAGRPVMINVQKDLPIGNTHYAGHYCTLLGINEQGQIFLGDPGRDNNSGWYDQSQIFTGAIVNMIIIDS